MIQVHRQYTISDLENELERIFSKISVNELVRGEHYSFKTKDLRRTSLIINDRLINIIYVLLPACLRIASKNLNLRLRYREYNWKDAKTKTFIITIEESWD